MTLHRALAALLLAAAAATPLAAQQTSESYKFLQAVKEAKGTDVTAILERPGSTIINARDPDSGEGALHIVIRRDDVTYMRYLLGKGADANMRDGKGDTPLMLAVMTGDAEMIPYLSRAGANANIANSAGETPLIRATQRRDLTMVRQLLAIGADPDATDNVAGLSARQYATRDPRNQPIAKLFADTPKKNRRDVAGPKF